jgi:hypothetical protein
VPHAAECRAELVRQSPERSPPATEALQYWTVLVVFAGKQEVVLLEPPFVNEPGSDGLAICLGSEALRRQPR